MMSREKQIEEMAKVMCGYYGTEKCYDCRYCCDCHIKQEANRLCNAGYRKQSEGEWISIEERLPESLQRVLAIDTEGDMFTSVYVSFATGRNAWSTSFRHLGSVTHWMPLPEPPGAKEGAE